MINFEDSSQLREFNEEMKKFHELTLKALIHFANIDQNYDDREKTIVKNYAEKHNLNEH